MSGEGREATAALGGSRATPVDQCGACNAEYAAWDDGSGMQWCLCGGGRGVNMNESPSVCDDRPGAPCGWQEPYDAGTCKARPSDSENPWTCE